MAPLDRTMPSMNASAPQPPLCDQRQIESMLVAAARQNDLHAIILTRPDATISWVNATAAQLFGHPVDAMVGRPVDMLFLPGDVERGVPDLERRASDACVHSEDDRWMMRADGSAFWATGVTIAVRDEAGGLRGYAKVLRNRTDLHEHIVALRNERDSLRVEQGRSATELAKSVHELRNALGVVVNASAVLRSVAADCDPRVSDTATILQRQVEQMKRLTDDLMAWKEGHRAWQVRCSRVVLQHAIREAVDAVATDTADGDRLALLLLPAPVEVEVDPLHLQQILVNLLGNAIKYTPRDRPIWLRLSVEDGEAVLRLEDRGIGIAPDVLAHIFELFTRAEAASDRPGSGIGLAVVKELVTLYRGTVVAQSEGVGKGSIFTVRLPLPGESPGTTRQAALVADGPVPRDTAQDG